MTANNVRLVRARMSIPMVVDPNRHPLPPSSRPAPPSQRTGHQKVSQEEIVEELHAGVVEHDADRVVCRRRAIAQMGDDGSGMVNDDHVFAGRRRRRGTVRRAIAIAIAISVEVRKQREVRLVPPQREPEVGVHIRVGRPAIPKKGERRGVSGEGWGGWVSAIKHKNTRWKKGGNRLPPTLPARDTDNQCATFPIAPKWRGVPLPSREPPVVPRETIPAFEAQTGRFRRRHIRWPLPLP